MGGKRVKPVYNVGINDADYAVARSLIIDGKRKQVWICPFYVRWKTMLKRCYSQKYHVQQPTYIGCSVAPEWHYFMTFRAWMIEQDWEGKLLDKDLLIKGNKIYGPDTCIFVDEKVNTFLNECLRSRGEWPIGVSYNKVKLKYSSYCRTADSKSAFLGYYDDPNKAHKVWLSFKLEQAKILANRQSDERVAKALIERYENYE